MARDLRVSPDGDRLAFTAIPPEDADAVSEVGSAIYVWDRSARSGVRLTRGTAKESLPAWSPTGDHMAYVVEDADGPRIRILQFPRRGDTPIPSLPLPLIRADSLEWSPGLRGLLVCGDASLPEPGSSRPGPVTERPAWYPTVSSTHDAHDPARHAVLVRASDGSVIWSSPTVESVWSACAAGREVLGVASTSGGESGWFHSRLCLFDPAVSESRVLYTPAWQLGAVAASSSGKWLAAVEGVASDRGLVAGDVLLWDRSVSSPRMVALGSLDATWIAFAGDNLLHIGGLAGLLTVFLEVDLDTGDVRENWRGHLTSASNYPEAAVDPRGGVCLVAESWKEPPGLCRIQKSQVESLSTWPTPGTKWLSGMLPEPREVSWKSRDGTAVSGLLVQPSDGPGPHPTVVLVHGGPAYCWRATWPGRPGPMRQLRLGACLLYLGYALFMPNPRGSSGRGQQYLGLEVGDYGGGESEDVLAGVDHIVASGFADPERLALVGGSHGGYMACWLVTRTHRFRAAVALSPITDWISQHFGSTLAGFDELFLGGDVSDGSGPYLDRSPVLRADQATTPMLIAAGLHDESTPVGQAAEFFHALERRGVEAELVVYPEERHGVDSLVAEIDFAGRVAEFLSRHVNP